jgi:hypothetical protein
VPSEATNEATRREWRELGFFYELRDDSPCWRLVGSATGLGNLVALLDSYVRDPRNQTLSEHEHYGPYRYLKIQTADAPGIDGQGIRGRISDLARLRDLIASGIRSSGPGQTLRFGPEYAAAVSHPLQLEVREDSFDPAAEDLSLSEPAG